MNEAQSFETLPVGLFPLPRMTLLPGQLLPLRVFEPRYRALVDDALKLSREIGVPCLLPGFETNYYGRPDIRTVFGTGQLVQHSRLPDGGFEILIRGSRRVRIVEELGGTPYRLTRVETLPDTESLLPVTRLLAEVERLAATLMAEQTGAARALWKAAEASPHTLATASYRAAALLHNPEQRQTLLEERDPGLRLLQLLAALKALAPETADEGLDPAGGWN